MGLENIPGPRPSPYNKVSVGSNKVSVPATKSKTSSGGLFGGKTELTRSEIREALKSESAFNAQQAVGLSLSSGDRAELEKKISSAYGSNISKSDLMNTARKLESQRMSSTDPKVREALRKEINFFKKIGGA